MRRFFSPAWVLLAAAVALAYLPVLGNGFFNFDDYEIVVDNPMVHGLGWTQVRWMFTSLYLTSYQPLAWLAIASIFSCVGADPRFFHAASLALHAANAVVLGLVLARFLALRPRASLTKGRQVPGGAAVLPSTERDRRAAKFAAWAGAFLWAVHPVRVGAVAWATKIADLMSALFFLLALLAYLGWREGGRPASRSGLVAAACFFLASGFSHWAGVMLPLALVLSDLHPLERLDPSPARWLKSPSAGVWAEKWPFLATAVVLGLINAAAKSRVEGIQLMSGLSHPGLACAAWTFHLGKVLFPGKLAVIYAVNGRAQSSGAWPGLGLALLSGGTLALALRRRSLPLSLGGWVFWLAGLLPTFAASAEGIVYAQDIYAYIPSMGLALIVAEVLRLCLVRGRLRVAAAAGIVFAGAATFILLTREAVAVWSDPGAVWESTLSTDRDLWVAHWNLAALRVREGRFDDARGHFREALRLRVGGEDWKRSVEEALEQMPSGGSRRAGARPSEAPK